MQHPTSLAFHALAAPTLSDEEFFAATALISTRFDVRGAHGDIRGDAEAPAVLERWFRHASARAPDLSIWQVTCQVHRFFDSDHGRALPPHWPWNARELILSLNDHLRANTEWRKVLTAAVAHPESAFLGALACCAAARVGQDPWRLCWQFLNEHIDDGMAWRVVADAVDLRRLGGYLSLARRVLMAGVGSPIPLAAASSGRAAASIGGSSCGSSAGAFASSAVRTAAGSATGPLAAFASRAGRSADGSTASSVGGARFPARQPPFCHVWREVLSVLARFPGHGVDLIERALVSPDTEVRLQAAELLLVYWRGRSLPPDTLTFLRDCALREVDPAVQEVMRMNLARV